MSATRSLSAAQDRPDLFARAEEAAAFLRAAAPGLARQAPPVGVVLGSGLGPLAGRVIGATIVPFESVPHFPRPTAAGHAGNIAIGTLAGAPVLMFQGRFHYYEGHDLETVTFPVRVLQQLGVRALVLTAAVGGVRAGLKPGDLVVLKDHINFLGANPLRGPNDERFGPRFPDMTDVYSPRWRAIALEEAARAGLSASAGVYACMPGPSYETPAEVRMLRTLGADVVGMSTVPEAIVARQAGMDVLALALVTNAAAGTTDAALSHEDVLDAGRRAAPALAELIERVIAWAHEDDAPLMPNS